MSPYDSEREELRPEDLRELKGIERELNSLVALDDLEDLDNLEDEPSPEQAAPIKRSSSMVPGEEESMRRSVNEPLFEEYEALLEEIAEHPPGPNQPQDTGRQQLIAQLRKTLEAARDMALQLGGGRREQERQQLQQEINRLTQRLMGIENQLQALSDRLDKLRKQLAEL